MQVSQLTMTKRENAGFSMIELLIVVAILLIVLAMVIPNMNNMLQNYRALGDTRGIAAQLALARMRAASDFTTARLNFSLTANTYQLEVWSKAANSGAGGYQLEGGVHSLSQGIFFGFGSVTAPAGSQSTIAQPSPSQITFDSRGFSVDGSGNPIGTAAIYVQNARGVVCAVSVALAGQATARLYNGSAWSRL
jgi:prepilin-type N-terminal cleavage/methylation domain-containing protein